MNIINLAGARALALWRLARRQIGPLMVLAAILIGAFAFLEIAEAVGEGEIRAFDEAILTWVRRPDALDTPIGPAWLKQVARDVTALGGWFIGLAVTVFAIGWLLLTGERRLALYVGVSVIGGSALSQLLKDLYDRPRPDLVPHLVEVSTKSFPSGHAMGSTVVWLTVAALMARSHTRKRVRSYVIGYAIAIVAAVGLTRIYLGVHWPSDVISGWAAGVSWALGCWLIVSLIERRLARGRAQAPESPESPEASDPPEPPEPSEGTSAISSGTAGARSRSPNA